MSTEYIVVSAFPEATVSPTVQSNQVGIDGDNAFINKAYLFYTEFPALNLPSVESRIPISPRARGWINGG